MNRTFRPYSRGISAILHNTPVSLKKKYKEMNPSIVDGEDEYGLSESYQRQGSWMSSLIHRGFYLFIVL